MAAGETTRAATHEPELPRFLFQSPVVATLARAPRARGVVSLLTALIRALPVNAGIVMDVGPYRYHLDAAYGSQLAVARRPFEVAETRFVRRALGAGDVFFDIGSNWGYFTAVAAACVGETGLVVAVEPNRRPFRRLTALVQGAGLSQVRRVHAAVDAAAGRRVTIQQAWYRNDTSGFLAAGRGRGSVPTVTLDGLWDAIGQRPVAMLKMDIEGAEVRALQGGRRFLRDGLTGFALIEVSAWSRSRFGVAPSRIYELLEEAGFGVAYAPGPEGRLRRLRRGPGEPVQLGNVLFSRQELSLGLAELVRPG